jgi:putative membrane protein
VQIDLATQLAYTRTHLANERTFAAWLRTGLAVSGAGYVLSRIAAEDGDGTLMGVGIALATCGAALILFGAWSFRRISRELEPSGRTAALSRALAGVIALLLACLIALTALFVL